MEKEELLKIRTKPNFSPQIPSPNKRKAFQSKPNVFVKRRENLHIEEKELQNNEKNGCGRFLGNLQEQLHVSSDEDSGNDSIGRTPHALMTPVAPVTDNLGLDLTPTLQMSEYNPSRFSGVVMRIREPHTTALIFRSGKVVVTGAKTEGEAHLASRKYGRIIQKIGFNVQFLDFKIQNIVGTYDLKFPLRVESLNQLHGQFCRYEPELFPGLIYRLVKPRVVLLIFVNGKIVLTGARNRNELREALQIMYPVLKSFKKENENNK